MKKSYSIVLSLAVVLGLSGFGVVSAQDIDEQKLIQVGKKIFFDRNLSVNKTQSCASCHDPGTGFTGPDSAINAAGAVEPGAIPERFGNRKPPSSAYAGDSPNLYYDNALQTWYGGMFWDGRATGATLGDPLAEQAMGPFLNPLEMAMPDARLVVQRVAKSEYAVEFLDAWGTDNALDFAKKNDAAASYERIVRTIAAYERSAEVNPYSSKFDRFYDKAMAAGKNIKLITTKGLNSVMAGSKLPPGEHWTHYQGLGLDDNELRGLAIFNDSQRMGADCASCHTLDEGPAGYPLLTDFGFYNLGIPKNPLNPFYAMPEEYNPDGADWIDYGLGGYLKSAGSKPAVYAAEMGKHKTPSLRNIDRRPSPDFVKAFGHNGFFKSLDGMEGIVHFYAWRATVDEYLSGGGGMGGGGGNGGGGMGGGGTGGGGMGGGGGVGDGGMTPNLNLFPPPEVDENRVAMKPFNFMMTGADLIAFLKTLNDEITP